MTDTIRVLIADDQAPLRQAFGMLVDSAPDMKLVAEAVDGEQALALAAQHSPDVVLMDVQMPRMNGLEATRALCAEPNGPRVVMLTIFDLDEYVYEALRAGASGFLLKNSAPAEVLRAIRVVHEGNALLAPEVTGRLIARLSQQGPHAARDPHATTPDAATSDARINRLSPRERDALTLIARGKSNAQISAELHVTPTTVRTYVSRIITKMDARDRASLVVIAYETGFISP